jgi:hypothetical protein
MATGTRPSNVLDTAAAASDTVLLLDITTYTMRTARLQRRGNGQGPCLG